MNPTVTNPSTLPRSFGQPDASDPPALPEAPKSDSIRDTIESIVIAFILAFVFRAFVIEAFVIPTGSMAPGLHGLHGEHRCAVCNYPFAYGIRESVKDARGSIKMAGTLHATAGFTVRCPNCGWDRDGNSNLNSSKETAVVAGSGDRILVLKWPYDIGGPVLGPKRWDVVVFKDPQDGDTNFIKRLLGLPGEVLEIISGDIYTAPVEDVPEDIVKALAIPPSPDAPRSPRLTPRQHKELAKVLKIQRKTRIAQDSLWMIHYDHDYRPDLRRRRGLLHFDPPRWETDGSASGAAWDASTACVRCQPIDDREHRLRLAGKPIRDDYGYNNVIPSVQSHPRIVGDVRLRFVLIPGTPVPRTPESATHSAAGLAQRAATHTPGSDSYLALDLRKGHDEFRATIRVDGTVLLDLTGEGGVPIRLQEGKIERLQAGRPLTISFENVDYRVALRVDDVEVVATRDEQYKPNIPQLLQVAGEDGQYNKASVEMAARNLPLEIRHLTVYRDVYYRSGSDVRLDERNMRGKKNPLAGHLGWGTASNPIRLRDDPTDYFCCGDNSPQSKDSRLWWEVCPLLEQRTGRDQYQLGTVPGDQLIGRAFFVYWPGGLRFTRETPAVIPNVGRMRIIR
jgi:signal peptidase I